MVRPTQHPSWHFVTTRVQNLHKRATRGHERGGNGGSCGLITRQNAPLAPVSIARHHDTSAQPPEAPPPDPPCRPDGAEGFRLASSQNTASSNCGLRAGKKTNLDWLRLMDSTQRPQRAPVCVAARAGSSSSHPRATDGRRPSSLPLTAMHNFRPKRTNNAPLFRSIQRCREHHANGHDQRTPAFPTWLLLLVEDAEATDDKKRGERHLGLETK